MRTTLSNGFHLAGVAGSTFGAFLISVDIPPVPNTRDMELELDGHTGIYDGGTEISRLDVNMQIGFWTNLGPAVLRQNIRNFIASIDPRNGYVPFIDDEDPTMYLNVKLTSASGSATAAIAPHDTNEVAATVSLQFKCADPHWYSTAYPLASLPSGSTYYTGSQTITNPGGAPVPALITIVMTGSASAAQISYGFLGFAVTDALITNDTLVISTDSWSVLKNGANAVSKWAGNMFQVPPGSVPITAVGAYKWRIAFQPRWLA